MTASSAPPPDSDPTGAPSRASTDRFIARWQSSGAAERANYQLFLTELCALLDVPGPDPKTPEEHKNVYVFERDVRFDNGDGTHSTNWIDLYKRGCFVLEAKQGASEVADGPGLFGDLTAAARKRGMALRDTDAWYAGMTKARGQAERYVRALPAEEGNPPFIIVVDVGHRIELYADFSRLGKTYRPFPDARSHRLTLEDLRDEAVRSRLRMVWLDPLELDPARRSAKVTREVAARLAELAKSLEKSGHPAQSVAEFLMRCLFTFFAEDVHLIKEHAFTRMLESIRDKPEQFPHLVQPVWREMDQGTQFSPHLRQKILQFNGGLFEHSDALPLNREQLILLIYAGQADWSEVEPAIFGTLLERALDEHERHKLGAHYTPRAYVERLVIPTVIEPLQEQFEAAKAAAYTLRFQGRDKEARDQLYAFLKELCNTTVLDPACGSGNFLYVTMDHMKRLEGEVRRELRELGETQELLERGGLTVDPHQFLGLEINPRAYHIADLVLWIGYLQWHFRTHGHMLPTEPVLRKFENIKKKDAVLAFDQKVVMTDDRGESVSRWDGRTMKKSPITGKDVPDEMARTPVYQYSNPRKAEWPRADYVVGNPPFIGNKRMRLALGDGYVQTLRSTHNDVPETADFVVYWWNHAAALISAGTLKRFGFITTNTITQTFNRAALERHLSEKLSLAFAIQDHPWVDSEDGAAVRISMTVGQSGHHDGVAATVTSENTGPDGEVAVTLSAVRGRITSMLTVGADVSAVSKLRANGQMSFMGVILCGDGFFIDQEDASSVRDEAQRTGVAASYISGTDLAKTVRGRKVIDFHGRTERDAQALCPAAYQWIYDRVRHARMQSARKNHRTYWWIYGESRPGMRDALRGIKRFIATARTAKFRVFQFLSAGNLVESNVIAIASDDAFILGVVSSRTHIVWSAHAGATLEDRPHYTNSTTFEPFPFPACKWEQGQRVRELGESLDAHRKRQQAAHPGLTITDMYNVLEKLRSGTELTEKDRRVHEQGLVSVLRQIHDDLDAAVAEAYGWPADLPDEEILKRLVALNAERAEEERRGLVRWLRPDFQNPGGAAATVQQDLALPETPAATGKAKAKKSPWPKTLPEQAKALRAALQAAAAPATPADLAKTFTGAKADKIAELLETLTALGQARATGEGRYVA